MARTAQDLQRHLPAAGLSRADLARWLGLTTDELDAVLAMDGRADPVQVWLVRDALDQAVREAGGDPTWSVLTDAARRQGQRWFRLVAVPPRPVA